MNEQQLRCFVQVAQNLSFARAAEALYRTQPTISHQIQSLENELGVQLFLRNKRVVQLSPDGKKFYDEALKILHQMEVAVDRLTGRSSNYENSFSVGFACASEITNLRFYRALESFHRIQPEVIPSIKIIPHKAMVTMFKSMQLECMFIKEYELRTLNDYRFKELTKDGATCVVPKDHPLASKNEVTLDDMSPYSAILCDPLVLSTSLYGLQDAFRQKHREGKIYYAQLDLETQNLVRAGYGIAIMRRMITPNTPDLVSIPIADAQQYAFGIAWHSGDMSPVIRDFVHEVRNECNLLPPDVIGISTRS